MQSCINTIILWFASVGFCTHAIMVYYNDAIMKVWNYARIKERNKKQRGSVIDILLILQWVNDTYHKNT